MDVSDPKTDRGEGLLATNASLESNQLLVTATNNEIRSSVTPGASRVGTAVSVRLVQYT